MQPKLIIFVMSFNRPEFLRLTLDSILKQTYKNFEVVVSDNSTDDRVEEMMGKYFPDIRCIKRVPSLDVLGHHNALIGESNSEYVTYFHDDDIMLPMYAEKMVEILDSNQEMAAAAPNAALIKEGFRFPKKIHSIKKLKLVSQWQELMSGYFSFGGQGCPPFPGYMYRVNKIKGRGLYSYQGGRHADYAFLDSLLDRGMLGWSELVLMEYRVHAGSSNKSENLADRRKLVSHICAKYNLSRKDPKILLMRFRFLFAWYKISVRKKLLAKKVLLKLSITFFICNSGFCKELLIKVMNKSLNIIFN